MKVDGEGVDDQGSGSKDRGFQVWLSEGDVGVPAG